MIAGEYAVLFGASALALAIDRRAQCTLTVRDEGFWQLDSEPRFWHETASLAALLSESHTHMLSPCLLWFDRQSSLPEHVSLHMDTQGFFENDRKLGLGSSAGVLVALYASLATLVNRSMSAHDLMKMYRKCNDHGSGIDVLTAFHGGLVHLKNQTTTNVQLPQGIYFDTYAVGFSTNTASMVKLVRLAFHSLPMSLQQKFLTAADSVVDSLSNHRDFFADLQHFIQIYRAINSEAKLEIWSTPHEMMYRLADEVGVLYKPSGAGGGDIGLAIATDPQDLAALRVKATDLPVTLLELKEDTNGVRIETTT